MLALLLDPRFKSLHVMESFMGCGNAIYLAIEFDVKEVIPFLMIVFDWLNLIVKAIITPCDELVLQIEKEDGNVFDVGTSMEESSQTLVTIELSLLWRLYIPPTTHVDPFALWWTHEGQFPNVTFLAKQILGIIGS